MQTFLSLMFLALAIVFPCGIYAKKLAVPIQAEAGIVMNAETGAILFEKNIHRQLYPASIAKIATAIYALHKTNGKLDTMIAGSKDALGSVTEETMRRSNYSLPAYYLIPDATHIGIKEGELLSLKDLLYGLMLVSGGDAANVIAEHVGGTIPDFISGVNDFMKKLGCTSSNLCNPHGLHHPKQVTTAYDMALLTKEALKNPTFREIVSTVRYTRPKTNKQEAIPWLQSNKLLRSGPYFYPKAIGVKTGYYSLAGSNLVGAAKDGDRTLIVVLLKEKERKDLFLDAIKLFEAAFAQPKVQKTIVKKGLQKFSVDLPGADKIVSTYTIEDLVLEYYPAEEPSVKCFLQWEKNISLPLAKDQYVGELLLQDSNGRLIKSQRLYANDQASATFAHRTKVFFNRWLSGFSYGVLAVLGVIAALLTCLYLKYVK